MTDDKHSSLLDSDDEDSGKIISPATKYKDSDEKEETVLRSTPHFRYTPNNREDTKEEIPTPKIVPDTPKKPSIKTSKQKIPDYVSRTPLPNYDDEDYINKKVSSLVSKLTPPDYTLETDEVKLLCYEAFRVKYNSLRINYPDKNIPEFPEGRSILTVHKTYRSIVKELWVKMNLPQLRSYYIIALMVIEFVCVKFLGLPMAGYFEMEVKRMYKYDLMMIELGHEYYNLTGGSGESSDSNWGIGYRFAFSMFVNIATFIIIKLVLRYINYDSKEIMNLLLSLAENFTTNEGNVNDIESGNAKEQGDAFQEVLGDIPYQSIFSNITKRMEEDKNSKTNQKKREKFVFVDD